jgi:ribosomal protein L21E
MTEEKETGISLREAASLAVEKWEWLVENPEKPTDTLPDRFKGLRDGCGWCQYGGEMNDTFNLLSPYDRSEDTESRCKFCPLSDGLHICCTEFQLAQKYPHNREDMLLRVKELELSVSAQLAWEEETPDFKIGDKVRIEYGYENGAPHKYWGKVGTVANVSSSDCFVKFSPGNGWYYGLKHLTRVEEEEEEKKLYLSVGDYVRIQGDAHVDGESRSVWWNPHMDETRGKVGIVLEPPNSRNVKVGFMRTRDAPGETWWYDVAWLEAVKEDEVPSEDNSDGFRYIVGPSYGERDGEEMLSWQGLAQANTSNLRAALDNAYYNGYDQAYILTGYPDEEGDETSDLPELEQEYDGEMLKIRARTGSHYNHPYETGGLPAGYTHELYEFGDDALFANEVCSGYLPSEEGGEWSDPKPVRRYHLRQDGEATVLELVDEDGVHVSSGNLLYIDSEGKLHLCGGVTDRYGLDLDMLGSRLNVHH